MWLLHKALLVFAVITSASILLAVIWWMVLHEDSAELWKQMIATWRTRRNLRRQRARETEWNPRGEAWRRFSRARMDSQPRSAHRATASVHQIDRGQVRVNVTAFRQGRDSNFGG